MAGDSVMTETEGVPRVRRNPPVPLGVNQRHVLDCLKRHGSWILEGGSCGGWVWVSPSLTRKVLDSLVRRHLVSVEVVEEGTPWERRVYRLVEGK